MFSFVCSYPITAEIDKVRHATYTGLTVSHTKNNVVYPLMLRVIQLSTDGNREQHQSGQAGGCLYRNTHHVVDPGLHQQSRTCIYTFCWCTSLQLSNSPLKPNVLIL